MSELHQKSQLGGAAHDEGVQNSKIVANPSPVASLTLQVFIAMDGYVQWVYVIVTSILLFYKIYQFSFPIGIFFLEALAFVILVLVQFMRLFLGSRGNKTESSTVTFIFILMTLGTICGNLYFLRLQTYVIFLEAVVGFVVIGLSALEFFFGVIAAIEFKSLENS